MRGLKYFLLLMFIAVYSCREPYDFDYQDVLEPTVVIDGFITNSGRAHLVRVSYSTTISERGYVETRFITDANVRIEDDQGGFTPLSHMRSGIYATAPQYAAQEGRSYKVIVTLSDGEIYESDYKTLPAVSPATAKLSFNGDVRPVLVNNSIQNEEGAVISVTINKDNDRHFYQWLIGHYFIIESDLAATSEVRFCYVRDFDESRVELLQDNPIGTGGTDEYSYEIDFVPITSKLEHDFGVEGRLLTLNEDDFNFWDKVKKQADNSGSLFDSAPYTIQGNIHNRATGEKALGYFGVYRESIDRVFFTQGDLGFGIEVFEPCSIPPMAQRPHPCEDCRLYEFQENLGTFTPTWWRN